MLLKPRGDLSFRRVAGGVPDRLADIACRRSRGPSEPVAGDWCTIPPLPECGEGREAVCAFPEAGISYSYTVRSLMRVSVPLDS